MTFLSYEDAKDACAAEQDLFVEADDMLQDARDDVEHAQADLADESSFWDESTWTDVGAYGAVAAACFTTPVGWAACGTATLLGSMGVLLSEADRQDEIDGAQHHLEEAQHDLDRAQAIWTDRFLDYSGCVVHHMSKGADAGTAPTPDE